MSSAAERAERLLTVLVTEERMYLELRELLQRERERIVEMDCSGIEAIVLRKEALAEEGRLLEECRGEAVLALATDLGLTSERPTLSTICEALGSDGAELGALHSRLVALVGAVQELLRANEAFAGESLARVQATLGLLGRLLPETSTYGRDGAPPPPRHAGRLVRQAV